MNFNGKKINFLKNNVNYLSKPKVKNNFSKYPCPDQAVAHLIFKNKIWIIDNKNNNISKRESNLKLCRQLDIDYSASISGNYILVILESPHFYEFNFQGNPLGPAIGKTGKNFQTNFSNIVNKNQRFKKILKNSKANINQR